MMLAIQELEKHGYRFEVLDNSIKFKYSRNDDPDPAIVRPLLEELKTRKEEAIYYLQGRKRDNVIDPEVAARKCGRPFPYPINETLGLGEFDPLDIRYINGKPVLDPGWWKNIPKER